MAYDYKEIEKKWIDKYDDFGDYKGLDFETGKEKFFMLTEFPYPSGSGLHVGHAFSMTGADVYARFQRMNGKNVMFPMGWDAFGLPTENFAIRSGKNPKEITKQVTDNFRVQMRKLGFSFDWDREVNSTMPDYYKWTQWIFVKLFEKGLAHKEEMPINWCPKDKIGLANEEVIDGKCERCGAETEKRTISQWVVKITDYADRLIEGLNDTDFIEKVKAAQINWIGKKEGVKVKFLLKKVLGQEDLKHSVDVFTTRLDTICGVSFIVISPELARKWTSIGWKANTEVENYIRESLSKTDLERQTEEKNKTGVDTGILAVNPITREEVPLLVADYVIEGVGTGAVMGVPAHDKRDFEFAKKYKLSYKPVVKAEGENVDGSSEQEVFEGDGALINSGAYDGQEGDVVRERIFLDLNKAGHATKLTKYHLRDWIFSRQHYWGEPIPMILCEKDGWVTVPEDQLPVVLPDVDKYEPTDTGESPLANIKEWVEVSCPKCGGLAKRETDTMPNWAGSDWYFLRYCDPKNEAVLADQKKLDYWMPVDVYVGGDEHNTLHLLYSRFIYQFLWDIGVVPKKYPEPYKKRLSHGVLLGPDGNRMSKSKGNVIVPDVVAETYGADVLRTYMMFMGPFDATMAWNERSLVGVKRFIEKVYKLVSENAGKYSTTDIQNLKLIHKLIKGAKEDIAQFKFNTAVAKMMETTNGLLKNGVGISNDDLGSLVKILAVFAPFVAEELWSILGGKFSVHSQMYPSYDERYLVSDGVTISVQVNGKMRGTIDVSVDTTEENVIEVVKENDKIGKYLSASEIKKVIYIPGKTINFVVI